MNQNSQIGCNTFIRTIHFLPLQNTFLLWMVIFICGWFTLVDIFFMEWIILHQFYLFSVLWILKYLNFFPMVMYFMIWNYDITCFIFCFPQFTTTVLSEGKLNYATKRKKIQQIADLWVQPSPYWDINFQYVKVKELSSFARTVSL